MPFAPLLALLLAGLVCLSCGSSRCDAHQAGDGFVLLTFTNGLIAGRVELALRELDTAIGLDEDGDGVVSHAELKQHRGDLVAYVQTNVLLRIDDLPTPIRPHDLRVEERLSSAFLVWRFDIPTPTPPRTLDLTYHCVFEVDPLHRGYLKLERGGKVSTGMFNPETPSQHFDFTGPPGAQARLRTFVRDGIWHIWTGYDHILFLLALLLPAVSLRSNGAWIPAPRLAPALWKVLQTVTAFTLAHSVTLSLAALGIVRTSPRVVEPLIALSVGVSALNNLRPFFLDRSWMVAFGFGLIHGFGFASALQEMDLAGASLAWPLVGFNLGVEAGQAVVVLLFVPAAFWLRDTRVYQLGAMRFGSGAILLIAAFWFVQRLLSPV